VFEQINDEKKLDGRAPRPSAGRAGNNIAVSPAMRLLDRYLEDAVAARASDLHFDPNGSSLSIRARIDGHLIPLEPPPAGVTDAMLTRLRLLSAVDLGHRRRPQDGRFSFDYEGRRIDVRAAFLPVQGGERATLRFIDEAAVALELSELGMPEREQAIVEKALDRPGGLTVVSGPTGSGKTTTLYACLQHQRRVDVSILTVEDPVERRLDGVAQVGVDDAANRSFASTLRAMLRHDPDIIMVGEMRDSESARIACRAALTGHRVLTTVHATDSGEVRVRLLDMDVADYLLTACLQLVVAQRLVRRLCSSCRERSSCDAFTRALFHSLGKPAPTTIAKPRGCARCRETGYRGRIALFELLAFDETGAARPDPSRSLIAAGVDAIAEQTTTTREVLAQCPDLR
jgi:type II secretory ATPase GspE/PulE/Tfp pilus assembly ATPase PilB-like protein